MKSIKGLTIVEALVCLVIIGIGFIAVNQLITFSIASMNRSLETTNVNFLSEMVIEDMIGDSNNSSNYSLVNINGSVVHDNYGWEIIILTFMFLAQIYIAKIVTQFYNLLPCDIDRDRVTLAAWP